MRRISRAASAARASSQSSSPTCRRSRRIRINGVVSRPNLVPLRPRWVKPLVAVAAVAACAALGLGLWATSLSNKLDRREADLQRQQQVAQILARPGSRKISFSRGTLVVAQNGEGALVLNKLASPGEGRTYEAWVADQGAPQPAGLFKGGNAVAVPLERPVPKGASVMVTEESAGGTAAPTQSPFVIVRNA